MREAVGGGGSANALRGLFTTLLLWNDPGDFAAVWEEFKDALSQDFSLQYVVSAAAVFPILPARFLHTQ